MNVLLSAFWCDPNQGSEHAIGWQWAVELADRYDKVVVITCGSINKTAIEKYLSRHPGALRPNLQFEYVDVPGWTWNGRTRIPFPNAHYVCWQLAAYLRARTLHQQHRFDVAHHVTMATIRGPSFMGRLGIPFILGPVGGGERAPMHLRIGYGPRGFLVDGLRDLSNLSVRISPLQRQTLRLAKLIYATTPETKALIPQQWQSKTRCQLGIGLDDKTIDPPQKRPGEPGTLNLLYAGRLLYWKGMHFGIEAFAALVQRYPRSRLTFVGPGGEYESRLRQMITTLNLESHVTWQGFVTTEDLITLYRDSDALLFPSLHDAGGLVALEAMAKGLPVVCLQMGGPGILVNEMCGRAIKTEGRSRTQVVAALTEALVELAENPSLRLQLSQGAIARTQDFRFRSIVDRVYRDVQDVLSAKHS